MPINNSQKLQQRTVAPDDQQLSRPGGAASRASTTIQPDRGSAMAGMMNALMGKKSGMDTDDVKKVSGGVAGRQFGKLSEGGNVKSAPKSPQAYSRKLNPDAKAKDGVNLPEGKASPKVQVRLFRRINMGKGLK